MFCLQLSGINGRLMLSKTKHKTLEPVYNDIGLYDTTSIPSDILS
jgi:hypothetical protein